MQGGRLCYWILRTLPKFPDHQAPAEYQVFILVRRGRARGVFRPRL